MKMMCITFISSIDFLLHMQVNSTKQDRDDFLSEAAILGQFTDPNVIFLQGVILKGMISTY